MERRYNLKSPAVKRLMREAHELREPTEQYFAQPLDDNLFEWHFTIRGPGDSAFGGGIYHGRIVLPPDYPMKPPSIILLTPNGRFEVHKKICLSISGHHPESWQPSWSIRTALLAIIGFMPTHGNGAIGSLDYTPDERKVLAKRSQEFKCTECGEVKSILKPVTEASEATTQEAKELASQINFQGEKEKSSNNGPAAGEPTPGEVQPPEGAAAAAPEASGQPQPPQSQAAPQWPFPPNMMMPPFMAQTGPGMFPMPPTTSTQQQQAYPYNPWMNWSMMPWMMQQGFPGGMPPTTMPPGYVPPTTVPPATVPPGSVPPATVPLVSSPDSNTSTDGTPRSTSADPGLSSPTVVSTETAGSSAQPGSSSNSDTKISEASDNSTKQECVQEAEEQQSVGSAQITDALPTPDAPSGPNDAADATRPADEEAEPTTHPVDQQTNQSSELRRRIQEPNLAAQPVQPGGPHQQTNPRFDGDGLHRGIARRHREHVNDNILVAMGVVAFFLVILIIRRLWLWDMFSASRYF